MRVHLAGTHGWWDYVVRQWVAERKFTGPIFRDPRFLQSYWDTRGMGTWHPFLKLFEPEELIMDSGLFTLMFGAHAGTIPATYDAFREYTLRYLDDLDRWGFRGLFVEADAHKLLGMEATLRLRELFAPFADRVIYVWHQPEGLDGLLTLARERSYIALSVPELRVISGGGHNRRGGEFDYRNAVHALLAKIHASLDGAPPPRIHLLGCTVPELVETRLAWTCDSTSWLGGVMYGEMMIYEGDGRLAKANIRSPKARAWSQRTLDEHPELFAWIRGWRPEKEHHILAVCACAHAWAEYAAWLDRRYTPVTPRPYDATLLRR